LATFGSPDVVTLMTSAPVSSIATSSVTYNGAPATGAVVYFQSKGSQTKSTVMAQEDGSFAMVSGSHGLGVAPGEYTVLVEWKRRIGPGSRRSHQTGPDRLQGRYADPRHPACFATVADWPTRLPTIELVGPTLKW